MAHLEVKPKKLSSNWWIWLIIIIIIAAAAFYFFEGYNDGKTTVTKTDSVKTTVDSTSRPAK
jgi:hypothetical protein